MQAAIKPRIAVAAARRIARRAGPDKGFVMGLILLEALAALLILVFIVWWTMFSGRDEGEPPDAQEPPSDREPPAGR
ncbi:hypothetical protein [Caldimonas tepidiphila]|uniref:hypothetical protein n=1 Tax=Caldimonas tepidiphila TaxID=2315841 RepID=UPI001F0C631B|nr:hypothetical protein [Caldimonas tepidiphila]